MNLVGFTAYTVLHLAVSTFLLKFSFSIFYNYKGYHRYGEKIQFFFILSILLMIFIFDNPVRAASITEIWQSLFARHYSL